MTIHSFKYYVINFYYFDLEMINVIAKMKEPVNSLTHLFGAMISIVGLVLLVYRAALDATVWHIVSFSIYGASLILLFSASSIYHMLRTSIKVQTILRKIDHMMIYLLIAGTYTPVTLVALRGGWGWSLFGIVWGVAITGMVMKAIWINIPRWLSTLTYILMGWIVVIAFYPLKETLPLEGLIWLIAGGIVYTLGAVIYGTKWPRITNQYFGFHEIFHIFVLAGAFCHYWFMYRFILNL